MLKIRLSRTATARLGRASGFVNSVARGIRRCSCRLLESQVNLVTVDWHVGRGFDPNANLVPPDVYDRDDDAIADYNLLVLFSRQN